MSIWKISGNTWTQTYGSSSPNPYSSVASNGVHFCEHICFTDRQKTEKKERWRDVWRMSWREEQKRRYPAAGCQHHGISTKCSVALQLQFREKQLQLCSCARKLVVLSGPEHFSARWTLTDVWACVYVFEYKLWTTNEVTDWRLVFAAEVGPVSFSPLQDFNSLLTLMDNVSHFLAIICSRII